MQKAEYVLEPWKDILMALCTFATALTEDIWQAVEKNGSEKELLERYTYGMQKAEHVFEPLKDIPQVSIP
jgi:hypothetical protein